MASHPAERASGLALPQGVGFSLHGQGAMWCKRELSLTCPQLLSSWAGVCICQPYPVASALSPVLSYLSRVPAEIKSWQRTLIRSLF